MSDVAPSFLIVDQHVARNPVARSIARAKIRKAADDFATRVLMLQDGEVVPGVLDAAARSLGLALEILSARGESDTVMRGGMSALWQMAGAGCRWSTRNAAAVDIAMQRAVAVIRDATALETQQAWVRLGS